MDTVAPDSNSDAGTPEYLPKYSIDELHGIWNVNLFDNNIRRYGFAPTSWCLTEWYVFRHQHGLQRRNIRFRPRRYWEVTCYRVMAVRLVTCPLDLIQSTM